MLSPEDEDWADSCLSKDPDMSDNGWDLNSLKDALLETRTPQNNSSPYERYDSTEGPKTDIFSKVDTVDGRNLVKTAIDNTTHDENDDSLNHENTDDFWSRHKMEDIFLPTYDENLRDLAAVSDTEVDFVFQEFELEQSTEVIFKIWDLDFPHEEEGGLVKQLNKALADDCMQDDEELDDLISGIADLALSPNSG